jgi:hypothetical protein
VNGYYSGLATFLDKVMQKGFLVNEHRGMVLTDASPGGLLDKFDGYVPPQLDKRIVRKKGL